MRPPLEPEEFTRGRFGRRLRDARLGSMGQHRRLLRQLDDGIVLRDPQLELLDEHHWDSLEQLASAIFEWIEGWYSDLSPAASETLHESAATAA